MKATQALMAVALLVLATVACTIEQTEEAELPDVDVEVAGGNLPEFDVDAAEIEVGMEDKEIEVPDVDVSVDTEKVTVKVPDLDIDMPDDKVADDAPDDDGGHS